MLSQQTCIESVSKNSASIDEDKHQRVDGLYKDSP